MKSELAQKLKETLDSMTQEQFDLEWSKISALKLEGPTFTEAIQYFTLNMPQVGKYAMVGNNINEILETPTTPAMAA